MGTTTHSYSTLRLHEISQDNERLKLHPLIAPPQDSDLGQEAPLFLEERTWWCTQQALSL